MSLDLYFIQYTHYIFINFSKINHTTFPITSNEIGTLKYVDIKPYYIKCTSEWNKIFLNNVL